MHSKQLLWCLGIISWSRSCHPGVSSSQGSPLRFPQIVSFREDPPTGAEGTDLVVSEEVFHWGWPQPLSWENSDLSPPFPTPRSSGMNPVLIISKNCPAIPDKNLCLFLLFKNHFQGPEQWAALYSSSVFLSPHFTLLTLLVPRGRCHTFAFEVFAVNARSQVLTI